MSDLVEDVGELSVEQLDQLLEGTQDFSQLADYHGTGESNYELLREAQKTVYAEEDLTPVPREEVGFATHGEKGVFQHMHHADQLPLVIREWRNLYRLNAFTIFEPGFDVEDMAWIQFTEDGWKLHTDTDYHDPYRSPARAQMLKSLYRIPF